MLHLIDYSCHKSLLHDIGQLPNPMHQAKIYLLTPLSNLCTGGTC